jgi:plastocyanin
MKNSIYKIWAVALFIILPFIGACAGPEKIVSVGDKKEIIKMTASNFKFEPAKIKAKTGSTISFEITNITSTAHDFTVKNPGGQVIKYIDLPVKKPITVTISLKDTGIYEIYCEKPFHKTMGMKGYIEAVGIDY